MIASMTIPVATKAIKENKGCDMNRNAFVQMLFTSSCTRNIRQVQWKKWSGRKFFLKKLENYLTFWPLSYRESIPCCLLMSIDCAIHLIKFEILLICQQVTRRRENGGIPIYFQSSHHPTCTIQQIARMQL